MNHQAPFIDLNRRATHAMGERSLDGEVMDSRGVLSVATPMAVPRHIQRHLRGEAGGDL